MKYLNRILAGLLSAVIVFSMGAKLVSNTVLAYNAGIEAFVNSLYSDCLGRSADPTGFNDWCNKLATGQISGKQAAYGFFFSPEFQAKANAWSDTELINAYYKVFLNRGSDPSGASYWAQQIAGTTNDISILFTGFADSVEFANKCASYGITVGPHVDVPTTVRNSVGGSGDYSITSNGDFTSWALAYVTNGRVTSLSGDHYIGWGANNPDAPSYPYAYGGTSTTSGIDCSGLNCYIANQYFGITNMPHNMYQQAATYGTTIDPSQIQPGDVICDYSYSHGDLYYYVGRITDDYGSCDYILRGQQSEDGRTYYAIISSFANSGYRCMTVEEFISQDPSHRRVARIG